MKIPARAQGGYLALGSDISVASRNWPRTEQVIEADLELIEAAVVAYECIADKEGCTDGHHKRPIAQIDVVPLSFDCPVVRKSIFDTCSEQETAAARAAHAGDKCIGL